MKTAVIVFPGSNCDHDAHYTTGELMGESSRLVWHKDRDAFADEDLIIVPGGFSYGDYLRTGAIARFAPIMQDVVAFAKKGGMVAGICNGFQILTECGLLPGALLRNHHLRFVCKNVYLRVENNETAFTNQYRPDEVIQVPIAHGDGNYFADEKTLDQLEEEQRIVFRYVRKDGSTSDEANPNGSSRSIAGILNETGNVLGMMPHPERCSDAVLGRNDGLAMFASIRHHVEQVLVR